MQSNSFLIIFAKFAELLSSASHNTRITSYNVCYTKLLRMDMLEYEPDKLYKLGKIPQYAYVHVSLKLHNYVITSYSIHYTKLYEAPAPSARWHRQRAGP